MTALRTFAGVHPIHHFQGALFGLRTDCGTVYMYEQRPTFGGDTWAVVEVDPERFLQLWRQPGSSHPEVAHQSPATWPLDRKYRWPARHFAQGAADPVALATVSCELRRVETPVWRRRLLWKMLERVDVSEHPILSFSDGVTRTIWLLAHGATSIPVKCPIGDAALLHELAGVAGSMPVSIGALFGKEVS